MMTKIMIYLTGALGLLLAISATIAYKQVQANGIYKANEAVYQSALDDAAATIAAQVEETKRVEKLLAEAQAETKIIYRDREVVRNVITEEQINAAPGDCINELVPDSIFNCLRDSEGCPGIPDN